jgi:hypothetical protein
MKKFIAGLALGLLLATSGVALASTDMVRIFVNGQEVVADVSPQIINGRVMVPARFIAEPLGATVTWDAVTRSVHITSADIQKPMQPEDPVNLPVQSVNDGPAGYVPLRYIVETYGISYQEGGIFLSSRGNEELFTLDDIDHVFSNNRIYVSETSLSWIEEQINNRPHL